MKKLLNHLLFTFLYRMNLMKKLLVSYVIVIIIPMLLLVLISYTHISEKLIVQFNYSANIAINQTSNQLHNILREIIDSSEKVVYNKTLTDIYDLNLPQKALLEDYEDYETVSTLVNDIFTSDSLYSVEIYSNGKYTLKESIGTSGISLINLEDEFAGKLDEVLSSFRGEMLWLAPRTIVASNSKVEVPVVTGARYIKSSRTAENIGIITVNINQEELNDLISSSSILSNSVSLILDDEGMVLAVSDETLLQTHGVSSESIFESIEQGQHTVQVDQNALLLNYSPIGISDWTLVSLIPYTEMLQTSIDTKNRMLLITLVISVLFCFAAYILSKLISKRIIFLANRMKEVQFDNYEPIDTNGGTDEVSVLINNYNYMLDKMNQYAVSQYELGVALKNTELQALQAQINPHFLYNTLDLLHWLAFDYGVAEISEVVSLLSDYYKLSLSRGMEIITVKDSIKHIEVYVKLQNFRFDNSIRLILNINPEMNDYGILKLLLQPIVENAILHGILEKEDQTGTITITGDIKENLLYLTVEDDGIGMTLESIEKIAHPANTKSAHGYGIYNVIERIKLYYGEEYGLTYSSTPGEGTKVMLCIPALTNWSK